MSRNTLVIAFLVFQAAMAGVWLWSLLPLLTQSGQADLSFVSPSAQVWSRSGDANDAAAPLRVWGDMWTATLFLLGSAAAVVTARFNFKDGRPMTAALFLGAGIAAAAAAVWFVSKQWSGATLFPAGSVNAGWLYTIARAWLIQFYAGFALLVVFTGLIIADYARKDRPLGFHLVALNWLIVVGVWLATYLALYVAPSLGAAA